MQNNSRGPILQVKNKIARSLRDTFNSLTTILRRIILDKKFLKVVKITLVKLTDIYLCICLLKI